MPRARACFVGCSWLFVSRNDVTSWSARVVSAPVAHPEIMPPIRPMSAPAPFACPGASLPFALAAGTPPAPKLSLGAAGGCFAIGPVFCVLLTSPFAAGGTSTVPLGCGRGVSSLTAMHDLLRKQAYTAAYQK